METNKIYQGNSLDVLKTFPDESIDCVMTSPPYYALRDYQTEGSIWDGKNDCEHSWEEIDGFRKSWGDKEILDNQKQGTNNGSFDNINALEKKSSFCSKCNAWKGNLGLEPNPELFIKHLCDIFDEIKRVLKKTGTCWVNLGDTYHGGNLCVGQPEGWDSISTNNKDEKFNSNNFNEFIKTRNKSNYPKKSLYMIPSRFAIEMINRGWILRNRIVWFKPACMPQSITDRFTVDFEDVFFFTKNQKYYFEQQFEEFADATKERVKYAYHGNKLNVERDMIGCPDGDKEHILNNEGRNKRCVWSINTESFSGSHFAVFPQKLVEIPLKAGCPEFICEKCGKARERIFEKDGLIVAGHGGETEKTKKILDIQNVSQTSSLRTGLKINYIKKGYSDCGCNAKFRGGVVLDTFFGAGTTGLVALKQNKKFIGIELNEEYIKIAEKRLKPYLEQTKLLSFEE